MSSDELPEFRYYPGAAGDGRFVRDEDAVCDGCGRARGWVGDFPAYTAAADAVTFCPWCVADGTIATKFAATFNEVASEAGEEAAREVAERTPGIASWQDWEWPVHCGDVGVFLGEPGREEILALPDGLRLVGEALQEGGYVRSQYDPDFEERVDEHLEWIDGGGLNAYLFRCPRCGTHLFRFDSD